MTNREYLNSLSNKKLVKFMRTYDCPPDYCEIDSTIPCEGPCDDCWVRWLKLEHEGEECE